MPPLIECRDLRISRPGGGAPVLAGITFALEPGEWAYVMGPSGGGKTTLLNTIAGVESSWDDGHGKNKCGSIRHEGVVLMEGIPVAEGGLATRGEEAHRRGIGLLFQEPTLWPHLTLAANVGMALANAPMPRAMRRSAAIEWMERLGIAHLADAFPSGVSGGEARRAELARTLAGRPRLLLLDEPMAHLDLHLRESLMELIRDLHARNNLTTLCVAHEIEPPMRPGDRVLLIESGRLAHDGPLSGIQPATPYTRALVRRLGMLS